MGNARRLRLALGCALVFSPPAFSSDTCTLKGVLGGQPVTMTHCAAAVFEDEHSVTLWFSDASFTGKELELFHVSSYAPDRTASGAPRTMMHFAFCPGGGKPEASAAAVRSVETGANRADSVLAGRQWVFDLPRDNDNLRLETLAGRVVPGGRIKGRITGEKTSDGSKYSWDAAFDLALPPTSAVAGLGCGN